MRGYRLETYGRRSTGLPAWVLALPIAFVIVVFGFGGAFQLLRPLPAIEATTTFPAETVLGQAKTLPFPTAGGSNVYVSGLGTIGTGGSPAERPLASVTKMMTAYVILKAHPLEPGESGPTVTLTAADASRFIQMQSEDQSVLAVEGGDRFTELDLLRGMLIASANNFAEIVANWDAGAVTTFVGKMNTEAQALGMTQTHYADASGFSSSSTSTPADQLKLAVAAMQNPVFAQIVGTESIRLPNVGLIENVNTLLGEQGVVGIKTGFTEQAGGNLAFAAKRNLQGADVTIIGMVLGQATRQAAFAGTRTLLSAVDQGLQFTQVVKAGQVVGTLKTPQGKTIDLVAREDATMMLWPGMTLQAEVQLDPLKAPLQRGDQAGTLVLRLGEQEARIAVDIAGDVTKPGLLWKLQRF